MAALLYMGHLLGVPATLEPSPPACWVSICSGSPSVLHRMALLYKTSPQLQHAAPLGGHHPGAQGEWCRPIGRLDPQPHAVVSISHSELNHLWGMGLCVHTWEQPSLADHTWVSPPGEHHST